MLTGSRAVNEILARILNSKNSWSDAIISVDSFCNEYLQS